MKELLYNYDFLSEKDITEFVSRAKAIIINDDFLYYGNQNGVLQFIGGHKEENETLKECLVREIKEESGICISINDIKNPIMKISYRNKDYPKKNTNRQADTYYFIVKTEKKPDNNLISLTKNEKAEKYKVDCCKLQDAIKILKDSEKVNEKNKVIARDMILVLDEYFSRYHEE